jgi:hydroxylamine reductase
MFCFQCEQTAHGTGCKDFGVCGKDHPTASLQDLLLYATEGVGSYAHRARAQGVVDPEVDRFVVEALFTTVTNVNFDYMRVREWILRAVEMRDRVRGLYESACRKSDAPIDRPNGAASWQPAADFADLVRQGEAVSVPARQSRLGEDIAGLIELYVYGLKGAASYADHALRLGKQDAELFGKFHEALDFLAGETFTVEELLGRCLGAGEMNLRAMELLDEANTGAYGHPVPTEVRIEPVRGKAILVSGHDLHDLAELLEQTRGTGINVYTHGEMLPAHGYPELNKHEHLVGNYGGPWMNQGREFDAFPGAILMTTNCIQRPAGSYFDRIFTSGVVAWPGVKQVAGGDFAPVIEAAQAAAGFAESGPDRKITVGFARNSVLGAAEKVIDAVKQGKIRHFFLIGGCDGAKPGRNYFTELAQSVPDDCLILTLACGKYRFNKLEFGEIDGLPRLLDLGQCNDAYSAIRIATALAEAFECGVNELPLSLVLSWYEQKAVAILLTLLHLGIRNIRLGPSLPAFVTPAVLNVLVEKFRLQPIGTPEEDLQAMLA